LSQQQRGGRRRIYKKKKKKVGSASRCPSKKGHFSSSQKRKKRAVNGKGRVKSSKTTHLHAGGGVGHRSRTSKTRGKGVLLRPKEKKSLDQVSKHWGKYFQANHTEYQQGEDTQEHPRRKRGNSLKRMMTRVEIPTGSRPVKNLKKKKKKKLISAERSIRAYRKKVAVKSNPQPGKHSRSLP